MLLARWKLTRIAAVYLAVSVAVAVVLGAGLYATRRDGAGFGKSVRDTLIAVLNPGELLDVDGQNPIYYLVAGLAGFVGILLPVVLLGAFVFKLFQQDPLAWRQNLSIDDHMTGYPVLRLRFYNAVASPLVNVTVQAVARIRSPKAPFFISNKRLSVLQARTMALLPDSYWAFSQYAVPFTVTVPLGEGLTADEMYHGKYICLRGETDAIERKRVSLLAIVSGTVLDTGNTFYSIREYDLSSEVQLGQPEEIYVDHDQSPRDWRGWDRFEHNSDVFVFGYASLVSPQSVARTIGHPIDPEDFRFARLDGWSLCWSVGSDQKSHPERRFLYPDGTEYSGLLVSLGIQRAKGGTCDGAVFPVSRHDLSALDVRERNYQRVDVTDFVDWQGKPESCRVVTYVPSDHAAERLDQAAATERPIRVRQGYLDLVKRAFAEIGHADSFERIPSPPFPVAKLSVHIDPTVPAPRAAIANPSYLDDDAPETTS